MQHHENRTLTGGTCSSPNGIRRSIKSLWGLADKAPVAYGLAHVYLVIRVLPEEELGISCCCRRSFSLSRPGSGSGSAAHAQVASEAGRFPAIVIVGIFLNLAFVILCSVAVVMTRNVGDVLHAPTSTAAAVRLPCWGIVHPEHRTVLLQTRFGISRIFWVTRCTFWAHLCSCGCVPDALFDSARIWSSSTSFHCPLVASSF
jgi:hypothetical protein